MLPDRVSNPGPLTYESGALPIALRGPARRPMIDYFLTYIGKIEVLKRIFTIILFSEKILHASFLSDITLRTYSRHIKQLTSHFDVILELT